MNPEKYAIVREPERSMPEKVIISIKNPKAFSGKTVVGERVAVGTPGDYKPCVAKLPSGELLLAAFVPAQLENNKGREEILLFRSEDGGQTWSPPENLTAGKGLLGREPYLTVLADGTVLMTVHFLSNDVRNTTGGTVSYFHRSEDGGATWRTTPVLLQNADAGGQIGTSILRTSRNVLEMEDGSLMLAVSTEGSGAHFIWRSHDRGVTWADRYPADIIGIEGYPGAFFDEGYWWQAGSGKIYIFQRLDGRFCVERFGDDASLVGKGDQYSRMVVYETSDEGRTVKPVAPLGDIGGMYPSILRLADGRLLLTFTVRSREPPLGVRAVLGKALEDGLRFDMEHDRFMLDTQTASGVSSGGGFGPTVQLDDGTLVTSYSWRDAEQLTHVEVVRWRLP